MVRIGTAGWAVPSQHNDRSAGSHLQQYARCFSAVEINSSFYRPHREATWKRWAESVPDDFKFSVKLSKSITHDAKLRNAELQLNVFLNQIQPLGHKLGVILIQLPPSLPFDKTVAAQFFAALRAKHNGQAALEPRHATWFTPEADELLRSANVARVAADPPKGSPYAATPAGDMSPRYYRLHGTPRVYYSAYQIEFLQKLAEDIRHTQSWVIFDNTAHAHAYDNALKLQQMLKQEKSAATC